VVHRFPISDSGLSWHFLLPLRDMLLINKVKISCIDEEPAALAEDKNRVPAQYGIDEQQAPTQDAQVPEGKGDNALSFPFTGDPLDEEPSRKESLRQKTKDQYVIINAPTRDIVQSEEIE
jgi:hypothetical protein